jgi:hypothetical protein
MHETKDACLFETPCQISGFRVVRSCFVSFRCCVSTEKELRDKQWSTKYNLENQRSSNTNSTKIGMSSGTPERQVVPAPLVTPDELLLLKIRPC